VAGVNELWLDAVAASRDPVDLKTKEGARRAYEATLKRFIARLIRDEPVANAVRERFERAGLKFRVDAQGERTSTMPVLDLPGYDHWRSNPSYRALFTLTGQHLAMLAANPSKALDPDNLVFMLGHDNYLMDVRRSYERLIRTRTVADL
jgi:hypothetical protein